ncbi:hypothetical protein PVK06_034737 [Gossypium arboreum]|uniref:Uncharacterized protein n=1 Tax=Gossypium arboreum TaxID=29729 RepID=A0ABR0NFH9_GOSAR|nr:hypothetical protein PVK06_034737 [Gossypium arboreum]
MLFRELYRTTDPSAMDIGRSLILMQLWALYQMPFLASISHQSYWSGIMAIEYFGSSVAYSISQHCQYDWGRSIGLTGGGNMEMIRKK